MCLSFPTLLIGGRCLFFSIRKSVCIYGSVDLIIGSDKKLLVICTSLGGILSLPEVLPNLIFLLVFLHPGRLLYLK